MKNREFACSLGKRSHLLKCASWGLLTTVLSFAAPQQINAWGGGKIY